VKATTKRFASPAWNNLHHSKFHLLVMHRARGLIATNDP
jgi:hypothetical protein